MKWSTTATYILATLTGLTLGQSPTDTSVRVGQHVIFSYPGTTPPPELLSLISAGKVGGLIIFGENVSDDLPDQIAQIQSTYASSPAYLGSPLLIMTDQEGGQIRRLPGGPEQSAKEVGAAADPIAAARSAGAEAAQALLEYKHNVNLAPVVDVYHSAGDLMDQWGRSFSNNASLVGRCAGSYISAQQSQKVLAAAKHFPGLGWASADENTDERPVTIDASLESLRAVDEAPYVQAIQAGVAFVMPSWAVYPAMDEKPAGLSEKWIGELRNRVGFKGVIVTDAIEAGALEDYGDDSERGVLAMVAGVDLVLAAARNVTQGESIVSALSKALSDGTLDGGVFEQSGVRVQAVRKGLL